MGRLFVFLFILSSFFAEGLAAKGCYLPAGKTYPNGLNGLSAHLPARYKHCTKPYSKLNKIHIKVRYKNSEVRFDPNLFYFTLSVHDIYATIRLQEELHFLYREYHRTISLRGPPAVA